MHPWHLPQLFAAQESFKSVVKEMRGFAWRAERPDMPTFVEQKWGYRAEKPGGCLSAQAWRRGTMLCGCCCPCRC